MSQTKSGDQLAIGSTVARAVELSHEALAEGRASGDGWIERLALCNITMTKLARQSVSQIPAIVKLTLMGKYRCGPALYGYSQ